MATLVDERMIDADIIISSSSDDEYTVEYYEYEMVDDTTVEEDKQFYNKRLPSSISVETVEVEEDDDDEYTYEEILEVVMEEKEVNDMDSTADPLPLPVPRTDGPSSAPAAPSTKLPPLSKLIPAYVPSSPKAASPPMTRSSDSSLKQQATPTAALDLLSPSKQRAKAANSAGLSELSKQLRVLQAKNESQNVDINRLERQLRILADLQGISVGDLRKALEDACASEAFGELQNRVSKLKYELEAATLLKQAELRKDAAAPYIANLELKVGELEEVEETRTREIRDLYESLRQEKAKSIQYESENQKLKGALQEMIHRVQSDKVKAAKAEESFQKQLQELRERQAKMMQEQASRSSGSSGSANKSAKGSNALNSVGVSPQMAAEYEQMVQLLKKKDDELRQANAKLHADEIRRAQKLKEAEERSREAQTKMKVEADKMALTVKELEDADGQSGLRLAQFKARFSVQNERIIDMGQQLDSLYTAFDLLKEEFDSEKDQRTAMLSNLNDADAEIARQTEKMEENKTKSKNSRRSNSSRETHGFPPSPASRRSVSIPSYVKTSPAVASSRKSAIATMAPISPVTPITTRSIQAPYSTNTNTKSDNLTPYSNSAASYSNYSVDFNHTPTTYATAMPFHPTPEKTPSTWDILRNKDYNGNNHRFQTEESHPDGQLICGWLIVETNGMLRKWKNRASRIYMRGEGYQWDIGEKRSFPLRFGISKVEFHPNYPLSFAVSLDPTSPNAPTIRAAASNEHEYHRWMTALYKATTGEEYQGGSSDDLVAAPPSPAPSYSSRQSGSDRFAHLRSPSSNMASKVEEPEDADLQRILELSKYET